ncbi:MAG: MFS transporter, partial [Bacteroidota bacterium]|nr:MFS transporter [Bacteroidota bacterium]
MNFTPTPAITEKQLHAGMHQIVRDGVSTEIMTVLSGGAFLVAMALLLGATNFQIGLIAALPTFMNLFQLVSLWLVRRFRNRKAISVFCSILARVPLILI